MTRPSGTAPDLAQVSVGDQLPGLTVRFTRESLVRYAGASTDFNPIHYSDHQAGRLGLPGVVAHGMLTMGTALRVVTDWAGDPARVRSYFARFTRPVPVPDDAEGAEVVFGAVVEAVEDSLVTIAIEAVSGDVKVLGAAKAVVDLGG